MVYNLIALFFIFTTIITVYFSFGRNTHHDKTNHTTLSNVNEMRDMTVGNGNHANSSDNNGHNVALTHSSPININLYKDSGTQPGTGIAYKNNDLVYGNITMIKHELTEHEKRLSSIMQKTKDTECFTRSELTKLSSELQAEIDVISQYIIAIEGRNGIIRNNTIGDSGLFAVDYLGTLYQISPYIGNIRSPEYTDVLIRLGAYADLMNSDANYSDVWESERFEYLHTLVLVNRTVSENLKDKTDMMENELINKYSRLVKRLEDLDKRIKRLETAR